VKLALAHDVLCALTTQTFFFLHFVFEKQALKSGRQIWDVLRSGFFNHFLWFLDRFFLFLALNVCLSYSYPICSAESLSVKQIASLSVEEPVCSMNSLSV
jgi:hypothetical protein